MILDITESDIRSWAKNFKEAEARLPDLVRRLVCSIVGVSNISEIRFPAYKAVSGAGYDGWLKTKKSTLFSDLEASAWEMSIRADIASKANEDYSKRTEQISLEERLKTTFVTLTANSWTNKEKWVSKKKSQNEWGDVRAYDASDLATWLSSTPPVSVWFSEKLGKYIPGVSSAEMFIEDWMTKTDPPLKCDVILAGRENEIETVTKWVQAKPSIIRIRSETVGESALFVACCLHRLNKKRGEQAIIDAVVVRSLEAWGQISRFLKSITPRHPNILIPAFSGFEGNLDLLAAHHLMFPYELGLAYAEKPNIILTPINREKLTEVLLSIFKGNRAMAERYAQESGGKITSVQRMLGYVGQIPDWVNSHRGNNTTNALLLAGQWVSDSASDKKILLKLSKRQTWDEIAQTILTLKQVADPPLRTQAQAHKWRSLRDAWFLLGRGITKEEIENYIRICTDVLKKPSPRFDLPLKERYLANIQGKVLAESDSIRIGLANTLAWLQKNTDLFEETLDTDVQLYVKRAVGEILDNDWKVWASLGKCLRPLAEASPEIFLEYLEKALKDPQKEFKNILSQDPEGSSSLFIECCQSQLLWALETLAWHSEFFPRVAAALMEMEEKDPGGTYSNRPSEVLNSLFDPLVLQTNASLEIRKKMLARLVEQYSIPGWQLLAKLIERGLHGGSVSDNTRPVFRDWDLPPEFSRMDPEDAHQYWNFLTEIFIRQIKVEPSRLIEVIDKRIFPGGAEQYLKIIKNNPAVFKKIDIRLDLQRVLRYFVHIEYLHSAKSKEIDLDLIQQFEGIIKSLDSGVPEEDFAWLFNHRPNLPEQHHGDYELIQSRINDLRNDAICRFVLSSDPLRALVRCSELSEVPWILGSIVAQSEFSSLFKSHFVKLIRDGSMSELVSGYISGKFKRDGIQWASETAQMFLLEENSRAAIFIMTSIKNTPEVRSWIHEHPELKFGYWSSVNISWAEFSNQEDLSNTIACLLESERWSDAVKTIDLAKYQGMSCNLHDYLSILRYGITITDENQFKSLDQWDLAELFKMVDDLFDGSCSEEELARLEIFYLPLLEHSDRIPKYITGLLKQNPGLFVDMICQIYRKKGDPRSMTSDDKGKKHETRARTAYSILRNWKDFPGVDLAQPQERDDYLREWCHSAMQLLKEKDREIVGFQSIGAVLARVPISEKDGIWPCSVAREYIEKGLDEIAKGMEMARHNERGISWRGLADGGKQERDMAKKYQQDADQIKIDYPRTAAFLNRIAEGYIRDSKRMDKNAERFTDP